MTREEMIGLLMWNNGGMLSGVDYSPLLNKRPKLKSIVAVSAPSKKYKDDELTVLVKIHEQLTSQHKEICEEVLYGDNILLINKIRHGWVYKRSTWYNGVEVATLQELVDKIIKS